MRITQNLREIKLNQVLDASADVLMDSPLKKIYPAAGKELVWKWFFPAYKLALPSSNEERRYHLHESHVQRMFIQQSASS